MYQLVGQPNTRNTSNRARPHGVVHENNAAPVPAPSESVSLAARAAAMPQLRVVTVNLTTEDVRRINEDLPRGRYDHRHGMYIFV